MTADRARGAIPASCFHSGRHLSEGELDPAEASCPLCLSRERRPPVFRLQAKPDVDLLFCEVCGGYSASRMPTASAIRDYYRDYYKGREERVTFDRPERLALHILRRAFPTPPPSRVEILDFGGGDAEITRRIAARLLKMGAHEARILLVDFNAEAGPTGSPRIFLERLDSLEGIAKGRFDLVVASAILEHIPRPRPDLIRLLRALTPGGVFYARTPTIVPLLRMFRRLRLEWDFTYPAHVHDLGQRFWSSILPHLHLEEPVDVLDARPALVETTFESHPLRTLAAHLLKAPWYVLGRSYGLVGGWEVFLRRKGSS